LRLKGVSTELEKLFSKSKCLDEVVRRKLAGTLPGIKATASAHMEVVPLSPSSPRGAAHLPAFRGAAHVPAFSSVSFPAMTNIPEGEVEGDDEIPLCADYGKVTDDEPTMDDFMADLSALSD